MRFLRLRLLTLFVAVLAALGVPAPAQASTGGTNDTNNAFSNVAFLLSYGPDVTGDGKNDRSVCSGTLVRDTLVLTAAHCTTGVIGAVLVSFAPEIADAPGDIPEAADPSAGYQVGEFGDDYSYGIATYTHPDYSDFTDLDNWNDVGAVELSESPADVEPATIAPTGTLGEIKKSNLSKVDFTAVGYGSRWVKPDTGPQKKTDFLFPVQRRYVDFVGQKLTPQILQGHSSVNKNKGTGGTCFGDSGGPVFYEGEVVAVVSYGNNDKCANIAGYQRVEIAGVQSWLDTLPLS